MDRQKAGTVNQLQQLPEGQVLTSRALAAEGYTRQQLANYVAAGWLAKVGHNGYRRPGPPLKWEQVLYSLQALKLPFYAGGETALAFRGYAHQLQLSKQPLIHIYGVGQFPPWVRTAITDAKVRHHGHQLFDEPAPYWTLENPPGNTWLTGWEVYPWGPWELPLRISSPERAWLEVLHGVPKDAGFEEADELSTGLRTLRPALMDALLRRANVKVRRLAFWLGERHRHGWVTKTDPSLIDLGTGKRSLSPGGRLVKKYGITVPKHLVEHV